jgi:pyruvate dehydrogenase E2 component (dihydrolipoamide acetyltransferase)
MATKVVMAQLSPTMEEGRLLEWKVKEGDRVEPSDILAEIETDKANMDIEALKGGVVLKILVEAGATVPVGATIGILGEPDEDISELLAEAEASLSGAPPVEDAGAEAESVTEPAAEPATEPAAESAPEPQPTPAPSPPSEEPVRETAHSQVAESSVTGRIRVSPVARRMAEGASLDLGAITGTGPGGRIVKSDVEKAIADGTARAVGAPTAPTRATGPAPRPSVAPAIGPARLEERDLDLSMMRKSIAKRLTESIGPVPHFFLTSEIDMGRALDMRQELNQRIAPEKIGVNDLLVKATAEALARHPEINASWQGDRIRRHGSADIGIAVAVDDGLITPVLREADRKGLIQIAREAADLVARARERKLVPEEYQGATFSVSNLGMFEIDQFTAIINPPEAGILAVGSTVEKPVVIEGDRNADRLNILARGRDRGCRQTSEQGKQ